MSQIYAVDAHQAVSNSGQERRSKRFWGSCERLGSAAHSLFAALRMKAEAAGCEVRVGRQIVKQRLSHLSMFISMLITNLTPITLLTVASLSFPFPFLSVSIWVL